MWNVFLSTSCTINLAPSISKSPAKGNDYELLDKISGRKNGTSRLLVLIG